MNDKAVDIALLALADPTRRAILTRLSTGEMRITDLAEPFEMSLSAVSKHIKVLERARLVHRRRAWREHRVRIDGTRLNEIADWMAAQRTLWIHRLHALDALFTTEDAASTQARRAQEK